MISRRTFLMTPLAMAAAAAADRKPNVILVIASGWRGQATPYAGDQDLVAPNLARLSQEGITFPRAYSGYPRLIPGRRILLDGRFAHLALRDDVSVNTNSIGARLKAAGYRAGLFGERKQLDDIVNFVHAPGSDPFYVEWTLAYGSAFIERVDPKSIHLRPNVSTGGEPEARMELAQFYERATARDHDLGVVLSALDRPELKDNTLVVFTSDRGEQLGSHSYTGDDSPYEESVRIPLVMRHPLLGAPGDRGMLVSQMDIAPTVLAFCGVPVPEEMQGANLGPVIAGRPGEPPDAVYAEGHLSDPDEWRMLVHGYDKLVTDGEGRPTHLYNLLDDPYELSNLVNVTSQELKRDVLGALLQFWRRKLGDGRDASGLRSR